VLHIEVKDNGCGMTKYQLDRIGLGLLVRAGGVIKWASILDIGTCATITFRIVHAPPALV